MSEESKRWFPAQCRQLMSNIPLGFLSPGMSKVALIVFPLFGQVKYIFVMGVTNYTFAGSNRNQLPQPYTAPTCFL